MKRIMRGLVLATAIVLHAASADASTKVPVSFDPTLGAQPARTQQKLSALEAKLPPTFALPATFATAKTGTLTLSFYPETLDQLKRAGSASATAMAWPHAPALCAKHAAFSVPTTLLAAGAAGSCSATEATTKNLLADASLCREVEEPERYVLAYAPAVVDDTTTGSIEALIGLAGEALSHHAAPDGLLPKDFVTTLRSVLWKIRRGAIDAQIAKAHASYAQVQQALTSQSACFDPASRTALATKLTELDAELKALTAHLDTLAAADLATAQHELVCMAAHSRKRAALPFPSLTRPEREAIAFWLGGIYWRMRGGGLMPTGSTQKARTYFLQKPFQRIADLTGGTAVGSEVGTDIYLNIFDGWGDWMDMGTTPGGQDLYEDLVQMTDRGRHQVQDKPLLGNAAVSYLDGLGYDTTPLVAGGLEMGPCYAYALGELANFRYADTDTPPPYGPFIEYFTAVGEFCTGASMSLGMAKTLLDGVPSKEPPADLCLGRTCGDDGCGGTCGTCGTGETCSAAGTCTTACVSCGDAGTGATPNPGNGATPDPAEGAGPDSGSSSSGGCAVRAQPATTPAGTIALSVALAAALVMGRRRRPSGGAARRTASLETPPSRAR